MKTYAEVIKKLAEQINDLYRSGANDCRIGESLAIVAFIYGKEYHKVSNDVYTVRGLL